MNVFLLIIGVSESFYLQVSDIIMGLLTEKFKDNIFYVIVSKNTNMEGIVRALFNHKGQKYLSDFRSDDDIVYQLEQFLNSIGPTPILLVLDDVWPESESFLEKFVFRIKDYKILVTSRSVFPRFGSTYKLKPLNYEDSLTLFRSSAFLPNQSQDFADENVVSKVPLLTFEKQYVCDK